MLIYLHGVSSSGKTSIGNELLKHLDNAILIDQDTYYKSLKPQITFVGDKVYTVANWDTAEVIDFNQFNNVIEQALEKYKWVIVTGFALRDEYMRLKADLSILLDIGDHPLCKITAARQVSKGYQGEKAIRDFYMVEKVVLPYYEETLKHITYHYKLKVFNMERRSLKELTKEILSLF